MELFAAESFPVPVPEIYLHAFRRVWTNIAGPRRWLSGQERLRIAALARNATPRQRGASQTSTAADISDDEVLVSAVERIATDPGSLSRDWFDAVSSRLGTGPYAEMVAVIVQTMPVDIFCDLVGRDREAYRSAKPGVASLQAATGVGEAGAWLPMTTPYVGPNVARALSCVPEDNLVRLRIVRAMYSGERFEAMVWDDSPLNRPQVELLAARTSALNECFY